jgi:surface polysaccharide O-acyltransferase-like enzyme
MWNTWGRICIGFVLMSVRTWWWISIKMEIRIQIGIKTMPLNNTGILASKKTVSSNMFFED